MSAYMEFATINMVNPALIIAALKTLGIEAQVGDNLPKIGGRQVQILVKKDARGSLYNWGFAWDPNRPCFNLIVNDYDATKGKALDVAFRNKLTQAYSKMAVARLLQEKKAQLKFSTTSESGTVMIKANVQMGELSIVIGPDGQIQADVAGVEGHACVTQVLAGLVADVGSPSGGHLKPEFARDSEAMALMESMGIRL